MKSTKDRILNALLQHHELTIAELAKMVGINGISVRHHLINLQADGLVISQEQRHGVGRPRYIYRLSKKGIEKFPTNYMNLTAHLLEALEAELPKDKLDQIYTRMGDEMAKRHPADA